MTARDGKTVYGYRSRTSCLVLALAVAAGLLAGYTLSLAEQLLRGQQAAVLTHVRLFTAPHSYAVLNSGAWSRSQWGRNCSAAPTASAASTTEQAAALVVAPSAPPPEAAELHPASTQPAGTKHLCQLPQVWSNCSQGIYLDIGTNVGVQLRKLYDPQQFPGAAVLPIFDRLFGSQRSGVCAVGIEANPHHTPYLEQLTGFFRSRGYQAVVLTETAASIKTGTASFFLDFGSADDKADDNPMEWAASLQQGTWHRGQAHVPLLDLPSFVMDVVRPILQQEQQTTGRRPPVVMKLDVEGEEYAILPGLMLSGGLCELDLVFMEHHEVKMRSADGIRMKLAAMEKVFATMRSARPGCNVNITAVDDESYVNGKVVPLPTWHETPEQQAQG